MYEIGVITAPYVYIYYAVGLCLWKDTTRWGYVYGKRRNSVRVEQSSTSSCLIFLLKDEGDIDFFFRRKDFGGERRQKTRNKNTEYMHTYVSGEIM